MIIIINIAGLDIGSSSVKLVVMGENNEILFKLSKQHFGLPKEVSINILKEVKNVYGNISIGVTGTNANIIEPNPLNDIPTLMEGLKIVYPTANTLVEVGAMKTRYITDVNNIPKFAMSEDCAGGTGSFFEDQMSRLGYKIKDYSNLVKSSTTVPRLSGRCSVFAKTDIIHRQQEGVATADILQGLCHATVKNIKTTVVKNLPITLPIAIGGGVINNAGFIEALKDVFNLNDEDLLIDENGDLIQAIGATKLSQNDCLIDNYLNNTVISQQPTEVTILPKLKNVAQMEMPQFTPITEKTEVSLGIDIGSTSTNLVLINQHNEVLDALYLRTKGEPEKVVKDGFELISKKIGDNLIISSVGITGSGRYLIGKMIGADCIKDEITAQAKAASSVNPNVDTVFEIGGQDSKYIKINNEQVTDFTMNKICAAGTGSFIEEQANRLNVNIEDYGEIALTSQHPTFLGDRCTVFIETSINQQMALGTPIPDILAGLCHSVISNYLVKVVENKTVGDNIVLQGGVCYNRAVISAFKSVYGDKITISPYFSVSGAYGVALLAKENIIGETQFKGLDLLGGKTQKDELQELNIQKNIELFENTSKYLLKNYKRELNSSKKTIGVPFSLLVYKFFPMIRTFFEALGYNVLLSPSSNEEIIDLAQKHCKSETCYPVKLIYGHMAWLVSQNVDYIFLPSVHTMKHSENNVRFNYGCVFMQTAPKFVYDSMEIDTSNIKLLNPTFRLDFGQEAMAKEMIKTGISLGHIKPVCAAALVKGGMAVKQNITAIEKAGKELLANINTDDKVLVMITRAYGIEDPVLNMNIPYEILKRGYKVITLGHLEAYDVDIDGEYENLYWPFARHITSGARIIANHPNLYPVFLTNHGCAPDAMIAHFFKEEIGDKPYLNIEVDEHFSKVGVITRIEAFLNSIDNAKPYKPKPIEKVTIPTRLNKTLKTYLPNVHPYSGIFVDNFNKKGYNLEVALPTSDKSIALGNANTSTKEYLTFSAILGDVLLAEQSTTNPIGFFIPQSEGSEAEGMYPRVIYSHRKHTQIFTKTLETLPFKENNFEEILLCIIAGDLQNLDANIKIDKPLTMEYLLDICKEISVKPGKKVYLVGDFYMVYNDMLCDNVFNHNNINYIKMPFSEYLLFMWKQRAETKEEISIVETIADKLKKIHQQLGEASHFDDIEKLIDVSNKIIGVYNGANGSYRIAKAKICDADAVIDIAPMYENTQTILGLVNKNIDKPILFANFEGTTNVKEKIDAFLYYIAF